MQQQQQQQDEAPVSPSPESTSSSLPVVPLTAVTGDSHDPISPTQRYHNDPHDGDVTTEEPDKTFIDEMDVDKYVCLLYTSPSPRDRQKSRMPSSA